MLEGVEYEESMYDSLAEGIGNEVLIALVLGLIIFVLGLAWYSTNLTNTQARLSSVRVNRRGVVLNRLPGCSIRDRNASQQEQTESLPQEPPESSPDARTDASQPGADVIATEQIVEEVLVNTSQEDTTTVNQEVPLNDIIEGAAEDRSATDTVDASTVESPRVTDVVLQSSTTSSAQPAALSAEVESLTSVDDVQETTEGNGSSAREASQTNGTPAEPCASSEGESGEQHPANEPGQQASADDDTDIKIRIKFLTDNERLVQAKKTDTVLEFKRNNFATELSNNKLVRLIFNGQVLQDSNTLQSCNITDNTAIHALISDIPTEQPEPTPQPNVLVFNAGVLLVPVFLIILSFLWYLRLESPELFNITSTMSLGAISGVFIYCLTAQMRVQPRQRNDQMRYGVNVGMNNGAQPQTARGN